MNSNILLACVFIVIASLAVSSLTLLNSVSNEFQSLFN